MPFMPFFTHNLAEESPYGGPLILHGVTSTLFHSSFINRWHSGPIFLPLSAVRGVFGGEGGNFLGKFPPYMNIEKGENKGRTVGK